MKKIIKIMSWIIIILIGVIFAINFCVVLSTRGSIKDIDKLEKADCILVLGAGVKPDGNPSKMLKDRLDKAIELYKDKKAPKLLLTGDNGTVEYNEVKTMAQYIKKQGVPKKDIFLDHAGFSTYESFYRAKDVFCVKSCIVVTQKYHEYRSLFIGKRLGLDVQGSFAKDERYTGQTFRDLREILARDKDFVKCIIKPKPKYLGDKIDIAGSGDETW